MIFYKKNFKIYLSIFVADVQIETIKSLKGKIYIKKSLTKIVS